MSLNLDRRIAARSCVALLLAGAVLAAQADDFTFTGNIALNTDIVSVSFGVAPASGAVKLWTDSWAGGLNYDPNAVLWRKSGGDYVFVAAVDDDDTVAAGQGFYDTGFSLASPAAGDYLLTIGASPYVAAGTLLSQGFVFDPAYGPIDVTPIVQWNQPSYDPNKNDQKGTAWQVHLSGVSGAAVIPAVSAVPEPSSALLLALGIAGFGIFGRLTRKR